MAASDLGGPERYLREDRRAKPSPKERAKPAVGVVGVGGGS